jgi:hypothetical protein
MRIGGLLAAASALALLTGCSAPVPVAGDSALLPTEVAPDSRPGFLDDPQDPDLDLPATLLAAPAIDVDTVRYQGEWFGDDLYLYEGDGTVYLLGVSTEDPELWHTASSLGNVPFALESGDATDDEWLLQYLPQGTTALPDGWTAFSPWLASRDS